jgi:L-asparaginase II
MLTPNRHNCSGKHTGMLAYVQMLIRQGELAPDEGLEYIDPQHPIQREIVETFAEMCGLPVDKVELGIDGCSAPNFAAPLYHAALAYARLADPEAGKVVPPERAAACRTITSAMMFNADMVGGPARFDTRLMEVAGGRVLIKAGAEGYQGMCLMPGALGPDSPAVGIALKIGDGDLRQQARPAVVLEVLRQLDVLSATELGFLSEYGPVFPVENWRKLEVGQARPSFRLERDR